MAVLKIAEREIELSRVRSAEHKGTPLAFPLMALIWAAPVWIAFQSGYQNLALVLFFALGVFSWLLIKTLERCVVHYKDGSKIKFGNGFNAKKLAEEVNNALPT